MVINEKMIKAQKISTNTTTNERQVLTICFVAINNIEIKTYILYSIKVIQAYIRITTFMLPIF